MISNNFLGDIIGRLGFGAMRLPVIDGDQANIDQAQLGRIRHLGFSSHGRPDNLASFLDYGARKYAELLERAPETAALFAGENTMEFCQIQMNYLDWTLQRASEKCALLEDAEMGRPLPRTREGRGRLPRRMIFGILFSSWSNHSYTIYYRYDENALTVYRHVSASRILP